MTEPSPTSVLSGFAYYLSESGMIVKQVALNALQEANANKESYIEYVAKQKLLGESQLARAAADYFGLPLCDISAFNIDLIPSEYLNIQLVRKKLALPLFKKSGLLYLAITDPTIENVSEIRFLTGLDVRFFIVESGKLLQIIDELLNTLILSEMSGLGEQVDSISIEAY